MIATWSWSQIGLIFAALVSTTPRSWSWIGLDTPMTSIWTWTRPRWFQLQPWCYVCMLAVCFIYHTQLSLFLKLFNITIQWQIRLKTTSCVYELNNCLWPKQRTCVLCFGFHLSHFCMCFILTCAIVTYELLQLAWSVFKQTDLVKPHYTGNCSQWWSCNVDCLMKVYNKVLLTIIKVLHCKLLSAGISITKELDVALHGYYECNTLNIIYFASRYRWTWIYLFIECIKLLIIMLRIYTIYNIYNINMYRIHIYFKYGAFQVFTLSCWYMLRPKTKSYSYFYA